MLAKPQGFPRKLGGCAGLDPRLRSAVSAGVGDGERGLRRGLRAPGVGVRPKWVLEYSPSNKRIRYFVSITYVRTGLWTAHKFCGGGGIYRLIQTDGEEGFDLLREAMDLHRSVLGSDSPELAPHLYKLAAVMDLGAAEANRPEITGLFREALSILRQTVPQEDPRILESIHFLADNLFVPRPPPPPPPAGGLVERKSYASGNQGREYAPDLILEEKEGLYREALELTTRLFPGDESRSASVLGDLATVLERRGDEAASNGDYRSAELFYREAVELTRRADSPLWRIVAAEGNLVDALAMSGSYTEAEDLLLSGYARLEQSDERQAPRRRTSTLERLIALYEVWGRLDIAAEYATRLATLSPP